MGHLKTEVRALKCILTTGLSGEHLRRAVGKGRERNGLQGEQGTGELFPIVLANGNRQTDKQKPLGTVQKTNLEGSDPW